MLKNINSDIKDELLCTPPELRQATNTRIQNFWQKNLKPNIEIFS